MAGEPRITDAVVLAAGLGERLRPLTLDTPKPALHFLNRPVIHHILDSLVCHGVRRAFVNTHHLPDKIEEALAPYHGTMEIVVSREPHILGTAGVFFNFKEKLPENFFVVNGDIFLDPPLAALESALLSGNDEAVLLLKERGLEENYTPLHLEFGGKISAIGEGRHFFSGLYAARRSFIAPVTEPVKRELVPLLLKPRIERGEIGGVVYSGEWRDLGSCATFLEATRDALSKMRLGPMAAPQGSSLRCGEEYEALVSDDASVGDGVVFKGFAAVGARCSIGKGAFLENAIVLPGTAVRQGTELKNCIVLGELVLRR